MTTLPGVNVLIQGATGTGKTHSIGTLVETGLHVHYLPFEAGLESLRGFWTDRGKPVPENLHVSSMPDTAASWGDFATQVKYINTLPYESLKKMSDPDRGKHTQLENFLRSFNDVKDEEGKSYGSIDKWGTDRALVIDGLTGLGDSAMKCVVGGKMDRDQKDWGLAMNITENIIRRLCNGCRCHFILLSHEEREPDPLGGVAKITVSTLGNKLAPKIPPMFSDVIRAKRVGKEFWWDTEDAMCDLKTRNLPISGKIPPDFRLIIEKWKSRGGAL